MEKAIVVVAEEKICCVEAMFWGQRGAHHTKLG